MFRKFFLAFLVVLVAFSPVASLIRPGEKLSIAGLGATRANAAPPPPGESGGSEGAPVPTSELGNRSLEAPLAQTMPAAPHTIYLKSRQFVPGALDTAAVQSLARPGAPRVHYLVQLDFIPRQAAKDELEAQGLHLLQYLPDYAWIASSPGDHLTAALQPGVTWAGSLNVEDKLDPAILNGVWSNFNLAPDGTAAVYMVMHLDESLETGRALVQAHNGKVTGEASGINMLVVEMPQAEIQALAGEDAVQWIEPAMPPLGEANDGIRPQIHVNEVQAAPYNLTGAGVQALIYDGGQVGNHPDTAGRLTHGDAAGVSDHSTHVAGTFGGSGSLSAGNGGSALQWRGMATGAQIISYAYQWNSVGYLFYDNSGDIQGDWAAAQNTYGADLGTASLGMNIYANYPTRCDLMGNYGVSSVLLDQIVRGGNAAVGLGDKYIATWAEGNERGTAPSCSTTYNTTAPPAGAKNPIQVGASNTNDNSMTTFSGWGPTDDGRLKPIIVAGGEQQGGDNGIKSTIPDMYTNNSTRDCNGTGDDYCYPYDTMQGTSMATPAVAGGIALMLEQYRRAYNTTGNFWPSTAKAILMQTATDFGNPGPDYAWGYGQVNIQAAVDLITRKAFLQDNVAQGAVDVYSVPVTRNNVPLVVSTAWDDWEATVNANPALVNNLDLELESPSGVIWRPWVLNPAAPASNATRGVDNLNNQEQVNVTTPEIGTWMVRVRGVTVPHGPQDYSLVCEGCRPLNLGVCQSRVTSLAASVQASQVETETGQPALLAPEQAFELPTAGELWQRSLESGVSPEQADQAAQTAAVEQARRQGPEAVVALADTLTGAARDEAMADVQAAREMLAELQPPLAETAPLSPEAEQARAEASLAQEAAERAVMLSFMGDPNEGQTPVSVTADTSQPSAPAADLTVGNGCAYASIQAAVNAASPGDRLRLEGNRTFPEHVVVNKSLTIEGGYNGCATHSTARTTVNGGGTGIVFDISPALNVTMRNLNITNGVSGAEGGGIRFALSTGTGTLVLENSDVYGNTGFWGAGIWVGLDAELRASNVRIYNNTSSQFGAGLRLFGGRATFSNSNIDNNTAPVGAGVYATRESGHDPSLAMQSNADVHHNHAATGAGYGGGLYLKQGIATFYDNSDLYLNNSIFGGGAYLITSTLLIDGSASEIDSNTTTAAGGGLFAIGSNIYLQNQAEIYNNSAGSGGAYSGGGAYLDKSALSTYSSSITYNHTTYDGGGVYASNGSTLVMGAGSPTCTGVRCSRLAFNTAGTNGYGGGVNAYSGDSQVYLYNTFVESNTAQYGGGAYQLGGMLIVDGSVFARNNATGNIGDGIRLNTTDFSGDSNTLAYNEAAGAASGHAFDINGGTTRLNCSIVWGHSQGVPSGTVSYSDVEGGYAGAGNLNTNPLFVNSGAQDYHLQSGSPLVDRCPSGNSPDFENELRPVVVTSAAAPYDMGADEYQGIARVGVDGACAYGTIQQAVNAAHDGQTVRVSTGVHFEQVNVVNKSITIQGGYNATCTTPSATPSRIDGGTAADSIFDIYGGNVTLRNLEITWGGGTGAGLDVAGNATVTLDNTDIFNNHGYYGGGVWVDTGSRVNQTNGSLVYGNTASEDGGGARIWGRYTSTGASATLTSNCATNGGGFSVPSGGVTLDGSFMFSNQAAGATGRGGAFYLESGAVITLTNRAFLGDVGSMGNSAYDGGAIYADHSTITLSDVLSTLSNNTATNNGGGVYLANNSLLNLWGGRIGSDFTSATGNDALRGAGVYSVNSTINSSGRLYNNIAANSGAGIYADNSRLSLTNASVGGTGADQPNQLSSNGWFGSGVYLTNGSKAWLDNTLVTSNLFQSTFTAYGGGAYLSAGSAITLTNSTRIQLHTAPSTGDGRGAGLYLLDSRAVVDHSQVISNTAGAAGGGIRLYGMNRLDITNGSVLRNNHSTAGEGGAVAVNGGPATINISNSSLLANGANTEGGAIWTNGGPLTFSGWWSVRNNTAGTNGGAVAITGAATAGFSGGSSQPSWLADNHATTGNGGGLYVTNGEYVELYSTGGQWLYLNGNTAGANGGLAFANAGATFDIYGKIQASFNSAGGNGGLLYLSGGSRTWLDDYGTTRPQVWGNTALSGGAVYAVGSPNLICDGTDIGSVDTGNTALAGSGGAFYLDSSTLTASNCLMRNNRATLNGGAISAVNSSHVTIRTDYPSLTSAADEPHVERQSPNAPDATPCNPLLTECSSYYNNRADSDGLDGGNGGAMYIENSTLDIGHTYLRRNQAVAGGAVFQIGTSTGTVEDSLFTGNTTTGNQGAGIRHEGGTLVVFQSTFADNLNGAGVSSNAAGDEVYNSIAWGNTNTIYGFNGVGAFSCNISQGGGAGLNLDPLFVGPDNYHLRRASPAVDACTGGTPRDLDGTFRPSGVQYDMGAFEFLTENMYLPFIRFMP